MRASPVPSAAIALSLACSGCYLSHEGDAGVTDSGVARDTRPADGADTRPPIRDGGPGCDPAPSRTLELVVGAREARPVDCPPTVRPARAMDCAFGPSTRECASLTGSTGANRFGAAVRGETLAAAWFREGAPIVEIGLFDRSLSGSVRCIPSELARSVAVASTPSGFLVAVTTAGGVEIHVLNPTGEPRPNVLTIPELRAPVFVSRPDGGPLLTGTRGGALDALLLEADGTPIWRSEILGSVTEPELGSGVYLGDRFLVAMRTEGSRVAVVTVELDGSVSCANHPSPERTEYPQIAWDGERGSITWSDFSSGIRMTWAGVDERGALTVGPTDVDGRDPMFNPAPNVGLGGVSYVLAGTHTGGTYVSGRLELHRFDAATGRPIGAEDVVTPRRDSVSRHRMLLWGDELVALWVREGSEERALGAALLTTGR